MKYKHVNTGRQNLGVINDNGEQICVRPNEEIILNRKNEGNGLVILEEIVEKKSSKKDNKEEII